MKTYSDLKSSISNELARTDLDSLLSDFVYLGESRINLLLRTWRMDKKTDIKYHMDSTWSIPDDLIAIRQVCNNHDVYQAINHLGFNAAIKDRKTDEGVYCIVAGKLMASPGGDLEITYCARIPHLSNDNDTNWVLKNHYDLYLHASLEAANLHLRDDDAAQASGNRVIDIISHLNDQEQYDLSYDPISHSNVQM